jgi:hypothetical protein
MTNAKDTTAELAARVGEKTATAFPGRTIDQLLAEDLPGNHVTTLFLHALRKRALGRTFVEVLEHAGRAAMTRASTVNGRRMHAFNDAAYRAARDFEVIELAPVLPLGAASCAGVDPNNVLGTARFAEVCSDPAVALGLHAASLERNATNPITRLCASHRVLRMQPTTHPGFVPHFRLFALGTATLSPHRSQDETCERAALLEHLLVWAELTRLLPTVGFRVAGLRVTLADTRVVRACFATTKLDIDRATRQARAHAPGSTEAVLQEAGVDLPRAAANLEDVVRSLSLSADIIERARHLKSEIADPLVAAFPNVEIVYDTARLQGLGYYTGTYIQITWKRDDGAEFTIGDGGAVPWVGAMRSNRRDRFVATGVGAELIPRLFEGTNPNA